MKTLHCDYFVPYKQSDHGDWWGAISITNHSGIDQHVLVEVFKYETGLLLREHEVVLKAETSVLISNAHGALRDITGRTRIYITCNEPVMAKAGNSRGTDNAIVWENMPILPKL